MNAIDTDGRSPLTIAIDYKKVETAKFLLANGAKANIKVKGQSALRKSFEKGLHDVTALLMESLRKELKMKAKVFENDCQDSRMFRIHEKVQNMLLEE